MAVYPVCKECGARRDHCLDVSAHKRYVVWRADVQFKEHGPRLRKTYRTQELAEIQERQWRTDYERGILLPKDSLTQVTFNEVADEWWTMAVGQNRIKNANISEYYRVKMFKEVFGKKYMTELKFKDGEDWLNDRIRSGKAINTVNRDMKPLKWIMDYAVTKEYLKVNPFKELKEIKGGNVRVRWMTEFEIRELINAANLLHDFALIDIIMVGVNTGFRKGNLERLTARDISHNRITASKTKSGKPYDVPIAPALVPTLQRLVYKRPVGELLDTGHLDARFRDAARKAGLYKEKGDPENVTIHTLRHTFAALYLKRGGDIYKLSKLLGHSSLAITERVYAHICPKELDAQAPLISTSIDNYDISQVIIR